MAQTPGPCARVPACPLRGCHGRRSRSGIGGRAGRALGAALPPWKGAVPCACVGQPRTNDHRHVSPRAWAQCPAPQLGRHLGLVEAQMVRQILRIFRAPRQTRGVTRRRRGGMVPPLRAPVTPWAGRSPCGASWKEQAESPTERQVVACPAAVVGLGAEVLRGDEPRGEGRWRGSCRLHAGQPWRGAAANRSCSSRQHCRALTHRGTGFPRSGDWEAQGRCD